MNEKIKYILIDITVVFLIPFGLFYLYITLSGSEEPLFGSTQSGSDLSGEGQKFLAKLDELKNLKLDTSLFESTVYKSLVDTTTPPPTEAVGRSNPFISPFQPAPPSTKSKTGTQTAVKNPNTIVGGQ
jgi:hypothetical protein